MGYSYIDVDAMDQIIRDMGRAADDLSDLKSNLNQCLAAGGVSCSLGAIEQNSMWIADTLPDLRRRSWLAHSLLESNPGSGLIQQVDESMINSSTPMWASDEEAAAAGLALAGRFAIQMASGDGSISEPDWETLRMCMIDPAFAAAFFNGLGTDKFSQLAAGVFQTTNIGDPMSDPRMAALSGVLGGASKSGPDMSAIIADYFTTQMQTQTGTWLTGYMALMSNASLATGCAVAIADWTYQTDKDVTGTYADYQNYTGSSNRNIVVPAVMAMLANNPSAATAFFTDMMGAVTQSIRQDPNQGGETISVAISPHIAWAVAWQGIVTDNGDSVGAALATAAGSAGPGGTLTPLQAQVGTQVLAEVTALRQQNPAWTPMLGIGNGVAMIIAHNMGDLLAVSPQIAFDDDIYSSVTWPPGTPTGLGHIEGGVSHLGVDATIFGTALQAIGSNEIAVNIVVLGWSDGLCDYLKSQMPTAPDASGQDPRVTFFVQPMDNSPALLGLDHALQGLDFIIDNLKAGVPEPAHVSSAAMDAAGLALAGAGFAPPVAIPAGVLGAGMAGYQAVVDHAQHVADTIKANTDQDAVAAIHSAYKTYVGALAQQGYFDPGVIAAVNATNTGLGAYDPTQPIPDGAGGFLDPPMMPGSPRQFDWDASGADRFLGELGVDGAIVYVTRDWPGSPALPNLAVTLP
ncbi:MAG: hypothetical protein FWF36_03170 [Propionibacteriaceae bacterium]|nr:hypothetical protein [Propionibacteriaceae bacterium]